MKNVFLVVIFLTLFLFLLSPVEAQTTWDSSDIVFDTTDFPQWAKDLRRFDIVAFGSFPFSIMFMNFFYDAYRWNKYTGFDFSLEGRQYAPWPFKSAGAIEKTSTEFRNTILLAVGLSLTIALADFFIVKVRRDMQRRNYIPPPSGTVVIERNPPEIIDGYDEVPEEEPEEVLPIE
jgi:hypothetical protein